MKVFWSWQNDYSPRTCRAFIRDALAEAVATVGKELGLEEAARPELDHDTKGEAGMVDIAGTILEKIAKAAVFVADVSPIAQTTKGKAVPNPNVLIELGWAMQRPGPKQVICVLNTADGWTIEDMPFDIRHRRILTYELKEGADTGTRNSVRRALVKDLNVALRTNLQNHIEVVDASTEIVGVTTKNDEPSIWATATETLTHQDGFGRASTQRIRLEAAPRGYIRVIPAGWKNGPPTVSDIAGLNPEMSVQAPIDGGANGDFGAWEHGFVRYWITSRDDDGAFATGNVAAYFDDTGEFWCLYGTVIAQVGNRLALRDQGLLGYWSQVMRRAFLIFDRFEAYPTRRVIVGLAGAGAVHWYGDGTGSSPKCRKNDFKFEFQTRNWDKQVRIDFLTSAYNGVRDLFALQKVDQKAVIHMLRSTDLTAVVGMS